jgi:hypothetical protein
MVFSVCVRILGKNVGQQNARPTQRFTDALAKKLEKDAPR